MSDTNESQQEHGQAMIDKAKGKAKETIGGLAGDNSTKVSGKIDSAKGEGREKLADIKDKLNPDRTENAQ
jgi:uncharacterized protein YjbJ (UPF0337 family)